jgi:hypothetical protein
MTTTEPNAGDRIVTWTALPDRDADRVRLVVLHLAAGVPVVLGLAALALRECEEKARLSGRGGCQSRQY